MNTYPSPTINKWHAAAVILALVTITLGVGWAWWNSRGPLWRTTPIPRGNYFNPMHGIEYVSPYVSFQSFVELLGTRRWTPDGEGIPLSRAEQIPPLAAFVSDPYFSRGGSLNEKERVRFAGIKRDFTGHLINVVRAAGFRPLPYATAERPTVSSLAYARLSTTVKTGRQRDTVLFQVETTLHREIEIKFDKTTKFSTILHSHESPVYFVAAKEALGAIKLVTRRDAEAALRFSRSQSVMGTGQLILSANPERISDENTLPPAKTQ